VEGAEHVGDPGEGDNGDDVGSGNSVSGHGREDGAIEKVEQVRICIWRRPRQGAGIEGGFSRPKARKVTVLTSWTSFGMMGLLFDLLFLFSA
jgi:hypothetical protein